MERLLNALLAVGTITKRSHFPKNGLYKLTGDNSVTYKNSGGCIIKRLQGTESCGTEYCHDRCAPNTVKECYEVS